MEDHGGEGGNAPAFVRWMARIEVGIASVLLLAALVVTIVTIVERNIGGSTGEWSLKLPELGLMWLTFPPPFFTVSMNLSVSAQISWW